MTVRRGRGMLPVLAATSIGSASLERVQRREAGAGCRRRQVSLKHPPGLISSPEDVSRRTRIEREMLPVSAATPIWPKLSR